MFTMLLGSSLRTRQIPLKSDKVSTPHDHFVRATMHQKPVAVSFFRHYLPEKLAKKMDFEQLDYCDTHFIKKNFRKLICDVLCRVPITLGERDVYLYCALEHQSTDDKDMALRMWQYALEIMVEHYDEGKDKPLPLVVPVVLYHGRQPFKQAMCLTDLIDAPMEFIQAVVGDLRPFHLVDTHEISDTSLQKATSAHLVVYYLKHIFKKEFLSKLETSMPILRRILREFREFETIQFLETLINYLSRESDIDSAEDFIEVFQEGLRDQPEENALMSVYEQIQARAMEKLAPVIRQNRQEGLQEGLQKGLQKGRREVAEKLAAMGMEDQAIVAATGISLDEISLIR